MLCSTGAGGGGRPPAGQPRLDGFWVALTRTSAPEGERNTSAGPQVLSGSAALAGGGEEGGGGRRAGSRASQPL